MIERLRTTVVPARTQVALVGSEEASLVADLIVGFLMSLAAGNPTEEDRDDFQETLREFDLLAREEIADP